MVDLQIDDTSSIYSKLLQFINFMITDFESISFFSCFDLFFFFYNFFPNQFSNPLFTSYCFRTDRDAICKLLSFRLVSKVLACCSLLCYKSNECCDDNLSKVAFYKCQDMALFTRNYDGTDLSSLKQSFLRNS
jgi:hypothetical protein